MPKGRFNPWAKMRFVDGVSAPSFARMTRMRFCEVSDTKMSPFGATRTMRGLVRPDANSFTVNPGSTDKLALAGRGTTVGKLPADGVSNGAGKSAIVM